MAKGTKVDIWAYIEAMKEWLELGYSIKKACKLAGIPERTVYDYYEQDTKVRTKIDLYISHCETLARKTIVKNIKSGSSYDAKYWLEKTSEDFREVKEGNVINIHNTVVQNVDEIHKKTKDELLAYFAARNQSKK